MKKNSAKCGGSTSMKKGGTIVGLNPKVSVQKSPGSHGVGPTKSEKASAQKKAGSNGVGPTKSQKATVSPKK